MSIVMIFAPVLVLAYGGLHTLLFVDGRLWELCIPTGRRFGLLMESMVLAVAVAGFSGVVAVFAGSYLWMRQSVLPMYRYLCNFILFLALLPPYVHTLAWSTAMLALNTFLGQAGLYEIPFNGFVASWWVEVMAWLPLSIGLVLLGLSSVDRELVDAGRLLKKGEDVFREIVLPLAAPGIIAGCGLVFLFSLLDYSVPSLFQVNTYSMDIFAEYSAHNSPPRAFLLAIPLLCVTGAVIFLSQGALRQVALKPPRFERRGLVELIFPVWFVKLQQMSLLLLGLQILVPFVSLLSIVKTGDNFVHAVLAAERELIFTFGLAVSAGVAALPFAMILAGRLCKSHAGDRWLWLLVTLPLALPAPLIGIGLIEIWNRPLIGEVYGTALMPMLGALARFTPIAVLIVFAQLRRIDPLLMDAARMMQKNCWQTSLRIRLPLYMPGLLAAFSLVAALTAGELGAAVLVAPPGQSTVTIKIYNFLHYGASETVAGLCLLMFFMGIVAAGIATWSLGKNKMPKVNEESDGNE